VAFDEGLAERIRERLARVKDVEERRMFGGICFLLNGNMLVGVLKDDLVVRLGPERAADALSEPHVRVFDFTGRPMRGWVVVEPDGLDTDAELADWLDRARAFVDELPAK
jgi:TfoX/Sxy family transcriptional regulator of competence genes